MTKEGDIVEIKYNNNKYSIKNIKDEQKVKPKDGKETDKEITVKDYEESTWGDHSAEIDGNKVVIRWGTGKRVGIYGILPIIVVGILAFVYFWFKSSKKEETKIDKN